MKRLAAIGGVIVLAGFVAALAMAQQKAAPVKVTGPGGPEEKVITAEAQAWFKAGAQKNADAFASYYAPDAFLLPPNHAIVSGKPSIQTYWREFFKQPGLALSGGPVHVEVAKSGDIAYDRGTFQLTVNGPDGKPVTSTGKYVVVWKKQPDGKWKAYADIFNIDK